MQKKLLKQSGKPTQRDLQKVKTRERIYQAAKDLFVSKGYFETRSGDIARLADVSHGSVFSHFKSKSEILERLHNEFLEAQIVRLNTLLPDEGTTEERMIVYRDVFWGGASFDVELSKAMFAQSCLWDQERENEYQSLMFKIRQIGERILAEGQEKGEINPDLDVVTAMHILQAQYRDSLRYAFLAPEKAGAAKETLNKVFNFICNI